MLEVAILFCLSGAPQRDCREVVFQPAEMTTPYQCINGAQIQAAKWVGEHPTRPGEFWAVKKWTCRRAGSVAKL